MACELLQVLTTLSLRFWIQISNEFTLDIILIGIQVCEAWEVETIFSSATQLELLHFYSCGINRMFGFIVHIVPVEIHHYL